MQGYCRKSERAMGVVICPISYSCYHRYNYRSYLSIYTHLVKRNHSVTMVQPMVERLRNRPIVSPPRRDYAKKIDPCGMLVWLGRRTVQNTVIGSGQYTLLSGRPVQTGQVLFEFKFTTAQSESLESEFNEFESRLIFSKNRFQLSAGLNLETLNTILSGTNHI